MNRRHFAGASVLSIMGIAAWEPPPVLHAYARCPQTSLVGTWKATTTFSAGPRAGEQETATFTFLKGDHEGSGALSVTVDGSTAPLTTTHGRWWRTERHGVAYAFLEPVVIGEHHVLVSVYHFIHRVHHQYFTSQGEGHVYPFPNGSSELPLTFVQPSVTHATRT